MDVGACGHLEIRSEHYTGACAEDLEVIKQPIHKSKWDLKELKGKSDIRDERNRRNNVMETKGVVLLFNAYFSNCFLDITSILEKIFL